MMTLDEAIKTCEENVHNETYAEEIRQLAEWLKELKELRSFYASMQRDVDTMNIVWRAMGKDEYDIFYKGL